MISCWRSIETEQDPLRRDFYFRLSRLSPDFQRQPEREQRAPRTGLPLDFAAQRGRAPALLQPARHPDARYSLLVLPLPALEPGPGPAGVTYIFAAAEHKLVQVNVLWNTDKPGDADRARMTAAGVQLADYFRALRWRPDAATMGVPLGPNGLVMFSGIDAHKAMVEVSLTGLGAQQAH
jgi:hypothetical protein